MDDVTKYGPKVGNPITSTEEIPFDKKRVFNPDLKPGEERVKQKVNQEQKQLQHQYWLILLQEKKLAKVNQQKSH